MSNTEIKLSGPITVAGAQVSVVYMREPTVADQLASDKFGGTQAEKEIFMFASLCDLSPSDIQQLKLKDYKKVQSAFLEFLD